MSPESIERVRESFRALAAEGPELFAAFVDRIGKVSPQLRKLLPDEPRDDAQPYLASCGMIVKNLQRLSAIEFMLLDWGMRQQMLGLQPQHYGVARNALLETLAEAFDSSWTPELEADWTEAIQVISSLMIRGAGRARARAA